MAKGKKKTKAEQQAELAEKMKSKLYNPEGENVVEFHPAAELESVPTVPTKSITGLHVAADGTHGTEPEDNVEELLNEADEAGEVTVSLVGLEGDTVDEEPRDAVDEEPREADEEPKERHSIVKDKFKDKYIENAKAQGLTHKAAKRSNWDWLSQQLAAFCLNDKGKIDIGAFTDVLEANGIDHAKWNNRNKGWEGRFRMTGRVALQKKVANDGWLLWPGADREPTEVPAEFRERYKTKA